jgi:aminopeptidase N
VNDKRVRIEYVNEHILIDASQLKEGANEVTLFFRAGDLSLNRNNDFLYTLLVPDRARTLFPCFDQPDLKARFQLSLQLPHSWQTLTNAPLADSVREEGFTTFRYQESDLFPTYLFSFVAGRFSTVEQTVNDKGMRLLYRETDSNKIRLSLDTIFNWHAKALSFLEEYTQISYPFQKLDIAAIPDFQYGGMEHVGAIDYKASTLFLDAGATRDQENARSSLIAHETAHMWFGNLVTMQWFNDVWMKEVFANFMADKITQGLQDDNTYAVKFLLTHFPKAYAIDRSAGANSIRQPLNNLQEAGSLYGPIIYNKAPVMMRQLERLMGQDTFRDGLRAYLKRHSFENASWPDLISILDNMTTTDLQAWNKVWVNTPGRPNLTYSLTRKNGAIAKLEIAQKGERDPGYLLPQLFEIALVYKNRVDEITVNMAKRTVLVSEATGKPVPDFILFNSSGQGYGVFPVDTAIHQLATLRNPVMRAAGFINLYENMLNGKGVKPDSLMNLYLHFLQAEEEELTSNLLAGYITDIYWRLTPTEKRLHLAPVLEKRFWNGMQEDMPANKKKILFKTYQQVAQTKNAVDNLYHIWKEQKAPAGVKLTEDDYTSLALALTLKEHADTAILTVQGARIQNPDRKQRLQFLAPALSSDVATRDRFFASLRDQNVRKKEAWVLDALGYLHHPLRAETSIRYLQASLEMLEDVQSTGDIFFPAGWLSASFGPYQSSEAALIVRSFLKKNPAYNPLLKAKVLQAADPLFRAERLVK